MSRLHAHIGTFRQLEILLAVHETGSMTRASEKLHLTQPSVSMQLKKVEQAVGEPIYNQVGRQLVFTEAGIEVVKAAREVMDSFERLEMRLDDLKGLKAGTLSIAVVTTSKYFIPHFLGDFVKQYPAIDIVFNVGNRSQIMERMSKGEDDFYIFSRPPEDFEMELVEFSPNPLVAIASVNNPLPIDRKISFEEFSKYPFLIREPGSGTRQKIDRHFDTLGLTLNTRMTIQSNEAIKHCVMADLGVSILSRHTLVLGGGEGIKVLDVEHLPIEASWYLVRLSQKRMSVVGRAFLEYMEAKKESFLELLNV